MLKTASVKCFLLACFCFILANILARKRESPCKQSWTKTVQKIVSLDSVFLNIVAVPVFPSPPSPESNVVVYSKESLIPGHFWEATLNWGKGFSFRKGVFLEIVLLRRKVDMMGITFSSSFVRDCRPASPTEEVQRPCNGACSVSELTADKLLALQGLISSCLPQKCTAVNRASSRPKLPAS